MSRNKNTIQECKTQRKVLEKHEKTRRRRISYFNNRGIDLDCNYIPRVEEARREKTLQCLCCYILDSYMTHEWSKKNGIKV